MNNTKIYIGNIPHSFTEADLSEYFIPFGKIKEIALIKDRETGRPKGFAFLTFEEQSSAQGAVQEMHGKTIDQRTIVVSMAKPPKSKDGRGGFGGRRDRY